MPNISITSPVGINQHYKDEEKPAIKIGRDASWADIVLPAEWRELGVGREHCELIAAGGSYELQLNGKNPVWVNGKVAFDGDPIPDNALISLNKDHPDTSFTIHYHYDNSEETVVIHQPVSRQGYVMKTAAIWSVTLFFVLSAMAFYLNYTPELSKSEIAQIEKSILTVQTRINDKSSHAGTAWVAAENLVITNRHVAEFVQQNLDYQAQGLEASAYIRLRSEANQAGETITIKAVRYHPGEAGWQAFQRKNLQRYLDSNNLSLDVYDIAILELEKDIAIPPLTLAADTTVIEMKTGTPLMMAGYPLNSGENSWDLLRPVPEIKPGTFDKLRNVYATEGNPSTNPIVAYNIETRGGNSGSPVMTNRGEVIAIHFASDKKLVTRQGTIAGVLVDGWKSYGQHIGLIQQLVSGDAFEPDYVMRQQTLWYGWLNSLPSIQAQRLDEIDSRYPGLQRCELSLSKDWQSFNKTRKNQRRGDVTINLPAYEAAYTYIQSLAPTGDKISVIAHAPTKSHRYSGKNHYFDFKSSASATSGQLRIQLTGPNLSEPWIINTFIWSDKACDSVVFEELSN